MTDWTYKPGSPDAVSMGCKCPAYDNNRGEGLIYFGTDKVWVINGECPLHGSPEKEDE